MKTMSDEFKNKLQQMENAHQKLISRKNEKTDSGNGIYDRYTFPIVTNDHTPLCWRYDLSEETNPYLLERIGVNATFPPDWVSVNDEVYPLPEAKLI